MRCAKIFNGRTARRILGGLSALALAASPEVALAETITIHAGKLIMDAALPARGPSTIIVADGRIKSVSSGFRAPEPGSRLVDLSTKTVLPGLIDCHVHLQYRPNLDPGADVLYTDEMWAMQGVRNARDTVKAGFTTVRDLGGIEQVSYALRDATARNLIPGPRIVTSGTGYSIIGGHADFSGFRPDVLKALETGNTCTGTVECTAKIRQASRAGANLIKIAATGGVLSSQARGLGQHFTDGELKAMIDTAHALGLKVAVHAHGGDGVRAAVAAGADSIEHATFADAATIRAMKASGAVIVPTLMAFTGIREGLAQGKLPPSVEAKARATLAVVGQAARAGRAAGVPVVFGTDAGVYEHGRNAEEFKQLIELVGMSRRDALLSATTAAAKLIGLEHEIGRIVPGYSADLIAVGGDPLEDIEVLQKVGFVMVRGRQID